MGKKIVKPDSVAPDMPAALAQPPNGYADWLVELKTRIHTAQQRAALAVNRELVLLYWQIGRDVLERQAQQGWGAMEGGCRLLAGADVRWYGFTSIRLANGNKLRLNNSETLGVVRERR